MLRFVRGPSPERLRSLWISDEGARMERADAPILTCDCSMLGEFSTGVAGLLIIVENLNRCASYESNVAWLAAGLSRRTLPT